jgi:hypothetical protein
MKRNSQAKKPDQYRAAKRRRYHQDVEHNRELQRAWRAAHPEVVAQRNHVRTETGYLRWKRYGLTKDECETLLSAQGYCCAICLTPLTTSRGTFMDHDHESGRVRGFLCSGCNVRLAIWERRGPEFSAYRTRPPASLVGLARIVPSFSSPPSSSPPQPPRAAR